MKKLFVISILVLSGCSLKTAIVGPKFKVGDCFASESDIKKANGPLERWEKRKPIEYINEVLEVGENKYRTILHMAGLGSVEFSKDISSDIIMEKVDCPKETR